MTLLDEILSELARKTRVSLYAEHLAAVDFIKEKLGQSK